MSSLVLFYFEREDRNSDVLSVSALTATHWCQQRPRLKWGWFRSVCEFGHRRRSDALLLFLLLLSSSSSPWSYHISLSPSTPASICVLWIPTSPRARQDQSVSTCLHLRCGPCVCSDDAWLKGTAAAVYLPASSRPEPLDRGVAVVPLLSSGAWLCVMDLLLAQKSWI